MGANNLSKIGEAIRWAWDYFEVSFNAVSFVDTYTYKVNGSYDATTGVYSDGQTVGYMYIKYDDVNKTNVTNSYSKKVI